MAVSFHKVKLKSFDLFPKVLGMPRYFEFEHQIISGSSSRRLAKKLQSEGYYLEIEMESLAQKIRSHRREVILPKVRRLVELESTTNISKADKTLSEQRNIALELSKLIEVQKARVNRGIAIEHEDGKLYGNVNREIRLLANLLNIYGQFQIKAGLIKSAGHNLFGDYNHYHETEKHIQGLMEDVEKRRQLAEATRKAMKILHEMDTSKIGNLLE